MESLTAEMDEVVSTSINGKTEVNSVQNKNSAQCTAKSVCPAKKTIHKRKESDNRTSILHLKKQKTAMDKQVSNLLSRFVHLI